MDPTTDWRARLVWSTAKLADENVDIFNNALDRIIFESDFRSLVLAFAVEGAWQDANLNQDVCKPIHLFDLGLRLITSKAIAYDLDWDQYTRLMSVVENNEMTKRYDARAKKAGRPCFEALAKVEAAKVDTLFMPG